MIRTHAPLRAAVALAFVSAAATACGGGGDDTSAGGSDGGGGGRRDSGGGSTGAVGDDGGEEFPDGGEDDGGSRGPLHAPVISMPDVRPNPIAVGGALIVGLDFTDEDGDISLHPDIIVRVGNNTPITAEDVDVTSDDGGHTGSLVGTAQLPLTLMAGMVDLDIRVRDGGGQESEPLRMRLEIVADPCLPERLREPNDDQQHATALDLGRAFGSCIEDSRDRDWFLVRTPDADKAGGYLVVTVTDAKNGLVPRFSILNASGGTLYTREEVPAPAMLQGWQALAGGQFVYIEVASARGPDDLDAQYNVKAEWFKVDDRHEPDNEPGDADDRGDLTIGASASTNRYWMFAGAGFDEAYTDVFRVKPTEGGNLKIAVTSVPSNLAAVVELLNVSGNVVADQPNTTPGRDVELVTMVTPGTYYVRVSPFDLDVPKNGPGATPAIHVTQRYSIRVTATR